MRNETQLTMKSFRLMSYPLHELEWVSKRLGKTQTEVVSEAILMYAKFWRDYYGESEKTADMD